MSRKSKFHRNPRFAGDGHFYQVYEWFSRCAAWREANVYERALYHELKRRYNGSNNGDIQLSHREAQELLNCSNTAVEKAFKGLIAKGFIAPTQKGSFSWKTSKESKAGGRATRWRLTELPQDLPERVLSGGTKEFMRWQPGADFSEKTTVRSQRTNGPFSAGHVANDGPFSADHKVASVR